MKLRVARHTSDLKMIKSFYLDLLGFELLGDFENHNGYDGVFIGKKGLDWHFEFTTSDEKPRHQSDEDDIIVLYPETQTEYNNLTEKLTLSEVTFIAAKNPYWNDNGKMFLDPDGFRIVISNQKINS